MNPTGQTIADSVFSGCSNRTQVATYLTGVRIESQIKGFVAGAVAGVALSVVLAIYMRSKT